ncbi:F-box protein: endocytic membrane traffic, recycling ReCYcling 1 [Thecaphora frezii]
MDRSWAPLSPTKRHSLLSNPVPSDSPLQPRSQSHPHQPHPHPQPHRNSASLDPFAIGNLPSTVVQRIFEYVPINDLYKCALAARPLARFVADERLWARRLNALAWQAVDGLDLTYHPDLSTLPASTSPTHATSRTNQLSTATTTDDDFGDFATIDPSPDDDDTFGGFASADSAFANSGHSFSNAPVFSYRAESSLPVPSSDPNSAYQTFKRIAIALKPFLVSLSAGTGPTASLLFSHPSLASLQSQASILGNIARFTSPAVLGYLPPVAQPDAKEDEQQEPSDRQIRHAREAALRRLHASIREAADYLEGVLLAAFEGADARRSDAVKAGERGMDVQKSVERSEEAMREHAHQVWQLGQSVDAISNHDSHVLDGLHDAMFAYLDNVGSSAALSFLEKRELFAQRARHDPTNNIIMNAAGASLDFTPMDDFMKELLAVVKEDGSLVARVFPEEQDVLLAYASRIANEVLSEYIDALLRKAHSISIHLYLRSCAASFAQACRLVEALTWIEPKRSRITPQRCQAVIFSMWEVHMDEYLQEERDWVRDVMAETCKEIGKTETASTNMDAAFLNSHNPAAVKRNVLSGFKDVLLMPVTVVPRAAGAVGGAMIRTAGSGLSQLNPLRWQTGAASSKAGSGVHSPSGQSRSGTPSNADKGYVDFSNGGAALDFDKDEDPDDDVAANGDRMTCLSLEDNEWSSEIDAWGGSSRMEKTASSVSSVPSAAKRASSAAAPAPAPADDGSSKPEAASDGSQPSRFSRLQLLLSLDTALQLIQLNRESLKRMETFNSFTGSYGARVKEEIEEIAVLFFQCLSEKHVGPGFEKASNEIKSWKPSEHGGSASGSSTESTAAAEGEAQVAPLVHFFELVHVGDTIQQMVQVYYDQELSRHIDRTDFLNGVVREKKRFEGTLDEHVASGLNVGVDLLMGQAEWLITTNQDPRDYYPEAGRDLDLANPTRACRECIECLRVHCKMLVGSTDKTVLEVFYQEVGIRLHGLICKHLKRQIISLDGGFKVIADINAYHLFISSLRQPSVTIYFDALKMLGNLYIIDNPKELAAIVRDANLFSGTLSPEDLYEFLHARADFKAIEKAVDKEIYGFKATEDCCVM